MENTFSCRGWIKYVIGWLLSFVLPVSMWGNGQFSHLTIDDGLAHTDATCIAQDSTGLMWIGTYAGLQSYDGYTLQRFDYYSQEQNIYRSHNRILAMACTGDFLWVGTESGLACFNLIIRKYVPFNVEGDGSAFGESVTHLCFNPLKKQLLIKTNTQAVLSSVEGDKIRVLPWNSNEERNRCKSLDEFQVGGGVIWGKDTWNLLQIGEREGKAAVLESLASSSLCGSGRPLLSFGFRNGSLYVRSDIGVARISQKKEKPDVSDRSWLAFEGNLSGLRKFGNSCFAITDKGGLWFADSYGLVEVVSPFSGNPQVHEYLRSASRDGLSARRINGMLIDNYDNLWITTGSWGVFYRSLSESAFHTLSEDRFRNLGFSQCEISAVCEQRDGMVWMLVEYGSLFRYWPDTDRLERMELKMVDEKRLFYQCLCLSEDEKRLYIGTVNGIFVYTPSMGECRRMHVSGAFENSLLRASIVSLAEDDYGRLWVATWGDGVYCIGSPDHHPFVDIHLNTQAEQALISDQVNHIRIKDDCIFLSTVNGLNRLRLGKSGRVEAVSAYRAVPEKGENSMSADYLADVDCENDSVCWIGTIGGGVNRLVLHSDKDNDYTATVYNRRDGLPDGDCEIVMLDRGGRVWIGGNSMTCLDPETGRVYIYDEEVRNKAFKINVSFKGHDGIFYMGGLYGLTSFYPESVSMEPPVAHVSDMVFSDLFVDNVRILPRVEYDGNRILEQSLDRTGKIALNHRQGNFSVSFSALGYSRSGQTSYRYRMKGLSDAWVTFPHGRNSVYFSNLPYGTYRLDVQCSSDGGYTWQAQGRTLEIDMLPPWWLSGWSKAAYVLLAVGVLAFIFFRYDKERRLEKENAIQKILLEQDEEKYQAKIRFFMNVSHELKTPLTLILLSAEKLVKENRISRECNSILQQTKRMLALISELVDFRKTDLGISKINPERVDLTYISRRLFDDIAPWVERKRISASYEADEEDIVLDADLEKMCKMLMNLLSNAIKYTGEDGEIKFSLHRGMLSDVKPYYAVSHAEGEMDAGKEACILTVRDTGVGISAESIRLIYERFFQVKGTSDSHLGSGIGLAIVKNIVIQHQGMIFVSSERGKGTEFIVVLPIYNKCAPSSSPAGFDMDTFIQENNVDLPSLDEEKEEDSGKSDNPDLPVVLVVEDNRELRDALREHFSSIYNVRTASNGKEGLELCRTLFPDIIVSDVMMPEMDGIEMCRRIKDNLSLAYIPVVLLTAKDNVESQIDGYESGADLYLSKPFSMKLLEVNVRRLLEQRKRWMKGEMPPPAAEDNAGKTEKLAEELQTFEEVEAQECSLLVEKLRSIINENLSKTDLSADFLASAVGLSRTKLYQKVKRIDGMSMADYVRNCRLEKAADLLAHTGMTVQEIVLEVGLVNPSHFSKIFKMKYGLPPYEYRQKSV